jgi:hypothetical protein
MITKSKQEWVVGQRVNVGFMKNLLVLAATATPGDFRPDTYDLLDERNGRCYTFTPHYGIEYKGVRSSWWDSGYIVHKEAQS